MPTKPVDPERGYSFSDFQFLNPEDPLPGDQVDIEFDRAFTSIGQVIDWAETSIADDGTIKPEAFGAARGEQGPQGEKGDPGFDGATGQEGPQGPVGPTGAQGPTGAAGQSYVPNATGLAAARSTYDSQPPGFSYLATDTGQISFRTTPAAATWSSWFSFATGSTGPQGIQGPIGVTGPQGIPGPEGVAGDPGEDGPAGGDGPAGTAGSTGWTPLLAAETDGNRRLIKVVDYIDGTGTKPATLGYLGTSGLTSDKALAIDFRQAALTVYTIHQFGPTVGGTTTFTIPGGYVPGTLRVFRQGLRQRDTIDFTATDTTTVVFTSPLPADEYVIIEELAPFEIAAHLATAANLFDVPDKEQALLNLGLVPADASTRGLVELASDAEALAKADDAVALTPKNLAALGATETVSGLARLATSAEALVPANATQIVTPATVDHYVNTRLPSWKNRTLTVSTAAPSGGADGDIWMQY